MRGLLIAVMLVAPACGEDNGNGGPYVPLDQIDKGYKTAQCKHLVMCGEFADQNACEAANLTVTFSISQTAVNAVLAGRMYYKGDVLAACFDKLATETCDTTDADGRYLPECSVSPFRGAQHAGDPCGLDSECISGVCQGNGGQGSGCIDGTCVGDTAPIAQQPAPIGQPCALGTGSGPSCVMGGFCDFNSSTCVALKASGTACNTSTECNYGLGCVGSPTRTCKPLPALNQPCPDFTCRDEGQVCGGAATTCTAYALPGASCASATCSPYYTCDFSATMKCIPYPTIGQSCASTSRCGDAGSYCDSTTMVCTALKAAGSACTNSNQCQSNFCDTVNGSVCAVTSSCT
jgi:hypothetical protein